MKLSSRIVPVSLYLIPLLTVISCLGSPYAGIELILQHIPTALGLVLMVVAYRKQMLGTGSFMCLIAYCLLHILGARYLYSYVPYESWMRSLFGTDFHSLFGWERNHYDRFIHFCYGLLFVVPIRELLERKVQTSRTMMWWLAIGAIMGSSMLYELIEWVISLVLAPNMVENYNGQQGDMWDAQKDMALASVGAVLCWIGWQIAQFGHSSRSRR